MRWLPVALHSVRVRLLVIALLPMLVLLPILLGGTMWRWSGKVDALLVNKVTGDLTIADQYLARLIETSGERIDAVARSVDLQQAMESGRQSLFLAGQREQLGLDFLRIENDPSWPVIESALKGQWHSAIDIFEAEELAVLSPELEARAEIQLVATRGAVPTERSAETRGMVIHSAAPLVLPDGTRAALVGGVLLNRNLDFIDTIPFFTDTALARPFGAGITA